MSDYIRLNINNYQQYAPFDIVVWYEMNELIDRSGKMFRLGRVDDAPSAPFHEIMHCEKGARLIDIFNDSEWVDFHTGLGTGGMMHRSISEEFFRRTEGMHVSEVRKSWRNIVLEILAGNDKKVLQDAE